MEKCIFCEIIGKAVPAAVIYDDERFVAFLDINPLNPGHTLVVPKRHVRWTYDVEDFGDYWEVAKSVALAAAEGLGCKFVNFFTVGLSMPHAHIHVIPRFEDDGHEELPIRNAFKQIPKEEMVVIEQKMRTAMQNHKPRSCGDAAMMHVADYADAPKPAAKQPEQKDEKQESGMSEDDIAFMKREAESG